MVSEGPATSPFTRSPLHRASGQEEGCGGQKPGVGILHSDGCSPGPQGIVGRSLAGFASRAHISCEEGSVQAPVLHPPSRTPPMLGQERAHTPCR